MEALSLSSTAAEVRAEADTRSLLSAVVADATLGATLCSPAGWAASEAEGVLLHSTGLAFDAWRGVISLGSTQLVLVPAMLSEALDFRSVFRDDDSSKGKGRRAAERQRMCFISEKDSSITIREGAHVYHVADSQRTLSLEKAGGAGGGGAPVEVEVRRAAGSGYALTETYGVVQGHGGLLFPLRSSDERRSRFGSFGAKQLRKPDTSSYKFERRRSDVWFGGSELPPEERKSDMQRELRIVRQAENSEPELHVNSWKLAAYLPTALLEAFTFWQRGTLLRGVPHDPQAFEYELEVEFVAQEEHAVVWRRRLAADGRPGARTEVLLDLTQAAQWTEAPGVAGLQCTLGRFEQLSHVLLWGVPLATAGKQGGKERGMLATGAVALRSVEMPRARLRFEARTAPDGEGGEGEGGGLELRWSEGDILCVCCVCLLNGCLCSLNG